MSLSMQQYHLVDLIRATCRIKQDNTPEGLTTTVDQKFLQGLISSVIDSDYTKNDLSEIVETAVFLQPGMRIRRAATIDKELYVDITG